MNQEFDHKPIDVLTRVNKGRGSTDRHESLELQDRGACFDLTRQMRT